MSPSAPCAGPIAADSRPSRQRRDVRRVASVGATLLSLSLLSACTSLGKTVAGCPDQGETQTLVRRYLDRQPIPTPPASLSIEAAQCGRDRFARELVPALGPVVGYKAGLTNEAVQKRFNYGSPMWGVLNQRMILRSGATVPAQFGARPVFEADLVAVVKSPAIHDAKTPLEVLQQISTIYPFMELPDLMLEDPGKITGPALQWVNVGARYGVLGQGIPVTADAATVQALADMTIRLVDNEGKELDRGKGSAILGQPLNAAIWLAADLKKSGITLKEGDLLSLGSFTKLLPPKPGLSVWAVYDGLPGNPSVMVNFK